MKLYAWKAPPIALKGGARDADPQAVGEALEKITGPDGSLGTNDVLAAARSRKSPLHRLFEWDDGIAAEAYRRHQARHLIGSIRLISNTNEPPARAFVSLRLRADGTRYRTNAIVTGSGELQAALLHQALGELRAMRVRYRSLTNLCVLLDKIIGEFDEEGGEAAA